MSHSQQKTTATPSTTTFAEYVFKAVFFLGITAGATVGGILINSLKTPDNPTTPLYTGVVIIVFMLTLCSYGLGSFCHEIRSHIDSLRFGQGPGD